MQNVANQRRNNNNNFLIPGNLTRSERIATKACSIAASYCVPSGRLPLLFNGHAGAVFSSSAVTYQDLGNRVADSLFQPETVAHELTACVVDVTVGACAGALGSIVTGQNPHSGAIIGAATGLAHHLLPRNV